MFNENVVIRRYNEEDHDALFTLIDSEGSEWKCYWGNEGLEKYENSINLNSLYLIFDNNNLCGYISSKDSEGFGVYVYNPMIMIDDINHYFCKLLTYIRNLIYKEITLMRDGIDSYFSDINFNEQGSMYIVR